jgi:hypothetical protein
MADLSQYVDFDIVMDNSTSSSFFTLIDVSNYPVGVNATVTGCFTNITQPDGLSIGFNDFNFPQVFWTGTQLTTAQMALRLATNSRFQNGGYSITYEVHATGYSPTVITKVFSLTYNAPTIVMAEGFNNFLPSLQVIDATNYVQPAMTLTALTQAWTAAINNVNGAIQNITGSGPSFDLNFGGQYYDANYSVILNVLSQYRLASPYSWVMLADKYAQADSFDSETPPSLNQLLTDLDTLKSQVDSALNNCNTFSGLAETYQTAMSIYSHFRFRGCANDFSGLADYVLQLEKIFNNGVTPAPNHTNAVIPAYNFGCAGAGGSIDWNNITNKPATTIIAWTVGDVGFPGNGTNTLTDTRLAGMLVRVIRGSVWYFNYTKALGSTVLTVNDAFSTGEYVYIETINF